MAAASTDDTQYTRLHITPFDESLLNIVISSSVLPKARNISYHTIEAFPEKRYGFVDLPNADAEKLKKKLNGAVLKGSKMRVEKARPDSIPDPTSEPSASKDAKEKKPKDKSKKRKREIDVTPGVELEDRKVKRGWTTTEQEMIKEKRAKSKKDKKDKKSKDDKKEDKKDKKKEKGKRKIKSKYTEEAECLFKTKLPASAPTKDNEDTTEPKKKKRKGDREVVIHEFEKTVKYPSFLKSSAASTNAEAVSFEDGIGWVDSNGKVVEAMPTKKPKPVMPAKATKSSVKKPTVVDDEDDETSSSGSSSSEEESDSSDEESVSSEDAQEDSEKDATADIPEAKPKAETQVPSSPSTSFKLESGRKRSSGSFSSLTIKIPTTPAKVHPLEALYKRPKEDGGANQGASKEPEPFSFFDNDDIEEDDSMAPPSQPPMTPYTKQDFDYRNVRSAAPTPDTAHPSRSFNLWPRSDTLEEALDEEDEEEDEELEGQDEEDTEMAGATEQGVATGSSSTEAPVSEFQKQFWESRGDLNRSWRKRRKMAAKDKRYRENKARAQRAI